MPAANSAGATEFIDRTTADVFIPEAWSLSSLVEREGTTVFGGLVDRSLERELKVGDRIYRPSISNLGAARTKSANTAITYTTVTESHAGGSGGHGALHQGLTVDVTTHNYMAIAIESIAKVQTDRNLMAKYSGKMGYSLAVAFDNAISALVDDQTGTGQTVGALNAALTYTNLTRSIQYLDDADCPGGDRAMIVSPSVAIGLMSHKEFVNSDYDKLQDKFSAHPGMEKAYQSSWWGIPFYKSTNLEGSNSAGWDNCFMHREAFVAILQMRPMVRHHYDIDYFADKVALEQIYGVARQRTDHQVWMRGNA